jgi:polyhydroxyalkanoate synthesis repressor PhaR
MKTIKRYPNRLLYDTTVSRFVSGTDLREYIRSNESFQVVDSRSGEDMTVTVLGQLFVDEISAKNNKRSIVETLRGFIALGGELNMDILKKTVLASIGVFEITKSKAEEIVDMLIKEGEVAKTKRSEAILELLDKAETSTRDLKERISKDVEVTIENLKVARKKDLEELNRKVDVLAEEIRKIAAKLG